MRFSKTNNIQKIIKITSSQDNILDISFGEDALEVKNDTNFILFNNYTNI